MSQSANPTVRQTVSQGIKKTLHQLWSFPGGVHLDDHKTLSNQGPINSARISKQLIIPLSQHIGQTAEPIVQVGDKVLKGQLLAHAEGNVSAPIHASSSGTVTAIEERLVPHPSGLLAPCVIIETDGYDQWQSCTPLIDENSSQTIDSLSVDDITRKIADTGIVGLGGALYPSAAKLNTARKHAIDILVINAAEC